ncbi:hypothetical protein Tco_1149805 [Tanacetum coccineum]
MINLAFVEANYEVLESLLMERKKQMRNKDLRTKLKYFSEEYDEEIEMEPRPTRAWEATPTPQAASLRIEDYPLSDKLKMPLNVGSYDKKRDPNNFLHLFEGAIRMKKWEIPVACHMFTYTIENSSRIWWNGQKTVFLWLFIRVIRVFRVMESSNILNKGDGPVRSIEKDALDARMIRLKGQVNATTGASKPQMATSESTSLTINPSMEGVLDVEEAVWLSHVAGDKLTMGDFAFDNFPTLLFGVPLNTLKDIDDFVQDLQLVDVNTKSTSYAGVAGSSTMTQPQVNSNFRPLVVDPIFNSVNISIPRKVVEKVSARLEHTLYGYFIVFKEDGIILIATFIGKPIMLDSYTSSMCKDSWGRSSFARCLIEKSNDGFEMVGKKKKWKGKSKSTNGGQFAGPSVKQTVKYEPKATPSAPKKGATNGLKSVRYGVSKVLDTGYWGFVGVGTTFDIF